MMVVAVWKWPIAVSACFGKLRFINVSCFAGVATFSNVRSHLLSVLSLRIGGADEELGRGDHTGVYVCVCAEVEVIKRPLLSLSIYPLTLATLGDTTSAAAAAVSANDWAASGDRVCGGHCWRQLPPSIELCVHSFAILLFAQQ